jgi:transcriptional regulator with XRE-family HTH domain
MTIAQSLDAERQRQALSVYALAKAAGMSPGRITAILSDEPSPKGNPNPGILTVLAVLAALGKSLSWLDRQLRATD